jgi:hypothetical protein
VEKSQERDLADQVFSTRNFVRTLSYREFVTSLSLALLLLAFYSILDYYSNENWVENSYSFIKLTLFCILIMLNHVFYKIEHKRQNNFIGRNLHDYIFLLFFVTLYKAQLFFRGLSLSFEIEEISSAIAILILFIIAVMLFEIAVTLVKRVLRFFKWQVL